MSQELSRIKIFYQQDREIKLSKSPRRNFKGDKENKGEEVFKDVTPNTFPELKNMNIYRKRAHIMSEERLTKFHHCEISRQQDKENVVKQQYKCQIIVSLCLQNAERKYFQLKMVYPIYQSNVRLKPIKHARIFKNLPPFHCFL